MRRTHLGQKAYTEVDVSDNRLAIRPLLSDVPEILLAWLMALIL